MSRRSADLGAAARAARWMLVALLAVAGCGPRNGPRPPSDIELFKWDKARVIAERYMAERDGWLVKATKLTARFGVPYLFVARPSRVAYLVRGGAVVEATGLEALGDYLDEARVLTVRRADARDLVILLDAFQVAAPSREHGDSDVYVGADPPDDDDPLSPRLRYTETGAQLSLFFHDGGGRGSGGAPNPEVLNVTEWILVLESGRTPAWSQRYRVFNAITGQLVEIDDPD